MQKSTILVDQLSYTNISISERNYLSPLSLNRSQVKIHKFGMVAIMMLLQFLTTLVLMGFMMVV